MFPVHVIKSVNRKNRFSWVTRFICCIEVSRNSSFISFFSSFRHTYILTFKKIFLKPSYLVFRQCTTVWFILSHLFKHLLSFFFFFWEDGAQQKKKINISNLILTNSEITSSAFAVYYFKTKCSFPFFMSYPFVTVQYSRIFYRRSSTPSSSLSLCSRTQKTGLKSPFLGPQ